MKTVTTWRKIITLATHSVVENVRLISSNSLHLCRNRLGTRYLIDQGGRYEIFRETINDRISQYEPVILIVGFRLRLIRSNPFLHWIFQRMCILTTPFWSGFHGFHIKLWMVDS